MHEFSGLFRRANKHNTSQIISAVFSPTVDPRLDNWKIHQEKFSIKNVVNFVRQWYKVELLIVHTVIEQQYTALTRIEITYLYFS